MQKKLSSNLLKQNCYIRDCVEEKVVTTDYSDKTYTSVDEVVTSNGVKLVENQVPYHITPQYVNSFVDSSDYRRDPVNAVINAPRRQNLGDITGIQDICGFDFVSAQKLYQALKTKFETPKATPQPVENPTNSEVK